MAEKEAKFWNKLGTSNKVQCQLCPHYCNLDLDDTGKCLARKNVGGKLISLVYNKPCSLALDPIEKKPLYHFLPGKKTVSIATFGCNFKCGNCQNWEISQKEAGSFFLKPQEVIKEARKEKSRIISYTYTEPTVFYEYMEDIARLAKKSKMKNVTVTNGFINQEPLKELCKFIDASNIDLKFIENEMYERVCQGKLEPVLNSIKTMRDEGVWIEITNLIIPGLNDSTKDIEKIVAWIRKNLGEKVPLHFTSFYPRYKMNSLGRTSEETLEKARKIALGRGLKYVYAGRHQTTYCPKCNKALIVRSYFSIIENNLKNGKCSCGERIPGIWN